MNRRRGPHWTPQELDGIVASFALGGVLAVKQAVEQFYTERDLRWEDRTQLLNEVVHKLHDISIRDARYLLEHFDVIGKP